MKADEYLSCSSGGKGRVFELLPMDRCDDKAKVKLSELYVGVVIGGSEVTRRPTCDAYSFLRSRTVAPFPSEIWKDFLSFPTVSSILFPHLASFTQIYESMRILLHDPVNGIRMHRGRAIPLLHFFFESKLFNFQKLT